MLLTQKNKRIKIKLVYKDEWENNKNASTNWRCTHTHTHTSGILINKKEVAGTVISNINCMKRVDYFK